MINYNVTILCFFVTNVSYAKADWAEAGKKMLTGPLLNYHVNRPTGPIPHELTVKDYLVS